MRFRILPSFLLCLCAALPALATGPTTLPTTKPDGSPLVGPYPKGPDHTPFWSWRNPPDDQDGDGWKVWQDCNDQDPHRNPGMVEWPFNDYDEDCDPRTPDRPNVVYYVMPDAPNALFYVVQGLPNVYVTLMDGGSPFCLWFRNARMAPYPPVFFYSWIDPTLPSPRNRYVYFWTDQGIWYTVDGVHIQPGGEKPG